MDEEELAAIKELWYTQPKHIKDKWLADPRSVDRLHGLWQACVNAPEWIDETQFSRVRLLERLDEGRNFLVLLGVHESGIAVCVKLPNYSNHPIESWHKLNKAIENEVAVLAYLREQAPADFPAPKLIDSGYCTTRYGSRTPYLVTAYWGALKAVNRCRPKSSIEALKLWRDVAVAVGKLHQLKIVHGDLHEDNLFVGPSGQPVILDFGSAQFHTAWPSQNTSGMRDFIPHISTIIDEVALPHQRLSPAFDVFCLTQCMVNCVGAHFPLEETVDTNKPRRAYRPAQDGVLTSRCFHEIVRRCSSCEPEFRPQSGLALADLLEMADHGRLPPYKPPRLAQTRVFMRRYPMLVRGLLFFAILLTSAGYFLLDRWQREHAQLQQQRLQSARLSQALAESNRASSIAYQSMRDLLSMTVRDDHLVPDQQKRWAGLRKSLVSRLGSMLDHNTLNEQTATESLQTGLKLIQAHFEVDGVQAAYDGCSICLEYCDRSPFTTSNTYPKFRILKSQLLANAANIVSELDRSQGVTGKSLGYARDSVDLFNSVDIAQPMSEDWMELYLTAAHDVLRLAVYSHRKTAWVTNDGGQVAEAIFQRVLSISADECERLPLCFAIAQLHALRALMLHKGVIHQNVATVPGTPAHQVRHHLSLAEMFLAKCEEQATDATPVTLDQIKSAEAVVANTAGLYYTSAGEHAAARAALERALQWREQQLQQRPGSIRCLRDCVNTAWNTADTYKSEAFTYSDHWQPQDLYLRELAVRLPLVKRCEQLVGVDRCQETETAHQVNALRLASAYRLAGRWDDVCQTLVELEKVQPLSEPGALHGWGEDLLLGLAVMIVSGQASLQHEQLFEDQCRYVEQYVARLVTNVKAASEPSTKAEALVKADSLLQRFRKLLNRDEWERIESRAAWRALRNSCETLADELSTLTP